MVSCINPRFVRASTDSAHQSPRCHRHVNNQPPPVDTSEASARAWLRAAVTVRARCTACAHGPSPTHPEDASGGGEREGRGGRGGERGEERGGGRGGGGGGGKGGGGRGRGGGGGGGGGEGRGGGGGRRGGERGREGGGSGRGGGGGGGEEGEGGGGGGVGGAGRGAGEEGRGALEAGRRGEGARRARDQRWCFASESRSFPIEGKPVSGYC